MKRTLKSLLVLGIAVLMTACSGTTRSGKAVTDEIGRTVTVPPVVSRVITLSPALTEIVYAIGADPLLVGVTDYCNYPPAAAGKTKVGGYANTNLEKVAELKPHLVLATKDGNSKAVVDKLDALGIAVFVVSPQDIDQIAVTIRNVGMLLKHDEQAERLIADMNTRLNAVAAAVAGQERLSVLCVIGDEPLYVVGPGTFPHDIITRAGGSICTEDAKVQYPRYSMEKVLEKDPEVIIKTTMLGQNADADAFAGWRKWKQLRAVRDGRLYLVNSDMALRPGPRVVDAVEAMARVLHGGNSE